MNAPFRPTGPECGWILPQFEENRRKYPVEELWKLAGRHIAWNWEGTAIVASAYGHAALFAELERLGIPSGTVVFDYVDDPDMSYF